MAVITPSKGPPAGLAINAISEPLLIVDGLPASQSQAAPAPLHAALPVTAKQGVRPGMRCAAEEPDILSYKAARLRREPISLLKMFRRAGHQH